MKYYRKVLRDLIVRHRPEAPALFTGAEVGVATGKTSAYLLSHLPDLHLWCIDRWCPPDGHDPYASTNDAFALTPAAVHEGRYQAAIARLTPYIPRVRILRQHSLEAACSMPDGKLDFVFIDGDHSYEGVAADIAAWRRKVRPGGLLCGHDYIEPPEGDLDARGRGVAKAVKAAYGIGGFNVAEGGIWWVIV